MGYKEVIIGIIMVLGYEGFNACANIDQRLRKCRLTLAVSLANVCANGRVFMREKEGGFDLPFVMYAHFASSCMPFRDTLFALHFCPFSHLYVCAYILYMYGYIILYGEWAKTPQNSVANNVVF